MTVQKTGKALNKPTCISTHWDKVLSDVLTAEERDILSDCFGDFDSFLAEVERRARFFAEDFDTTDKRAALIWARDDYDSGDKWGWCMSWLFDLCAVIEIRGWEVPAEAQYRSGVFGPHIEDKERKRGMAELTTEALQHAVRVLCRYERLCRRADLNY